MKHVRSRVHLLAAKEAPTVVILQRKRAKLFHIVTVDTESHQVTEGSWFRGVLYAMNCDVSFDGKYLVYCAMGKPGPNTWSGLCRLPWLKTLVEVDGIGHAWGGGYFPSSNVLRGNGWTPERINRVSDTDIPFEITCGPLAYDMSEGRKPLDLRIERDGFQRLGPSWGEEYRFDDPFRVECVGDDGYGKRPTQEHPELVVRYLGYINSTETFSFSLTEKPQLLEGANWATWDSGGNLWVARPGIVEQFRLEDINRGVPSFSLDVDRFEPPVRTERQFD